MSAQGLTHRLERLAQDFLDELRAEIRQNPWSSATQALMLGAGLAAFNRRNLPQAAMLLLSRVMEQRKAA